MVTHNIKLVSDESEVSTDTCGRILTSMPKAVEASIRMAVEGRSAARGVKPQWLELSSQIILMEYSEQSRTFIFEAPSLGESAQSLYEQEEFWPSRPAKELTGFDLFAKVLFDIQENKTSSGLFDQRLLRRVERFAHALNKDLSRIEIDSSQCVGSKAIIDQILINNAKSMYQSTPKPHQVRISGRLDMVRASTSTFAIHLESGEEVLATAPYEIFKEVRDLLEKDILITGKAVYRPSGQLLRIDAETAREATSDSHLWSKLPTPHTQKLDNYHLTQSQGSRSGISAILGKWPGDETDTDIERAMEEIS